MKDENIAKLLRVALVVGGVSALAPLVSAPFVNAQGIGVTELERMLIPTPQKIERGEVLYDQNCATCHGDDGQGKSGIELAGAPGQSFETVDFTAGEFRYGGGPLQIYNAFTYGLDEAVVDAPEQVPPHPKYQYLQYQSRWDIVHYVRSLGPTAGPTDPQQIVERALERAEKGVCDEDIKATISDKVTPQGEEQLARGEELYAQNCASCHGDQGAGDGPAAGALDPAPRNFVGHTREQWTNDPSPLGVFNVLATGVPGTSMASYANLPEEDRWALTHYVLGFVPEQVAAESTEEQIVGACRALSAPDKPSPIPVEVAMQAMIKDQAEERVLRLSQYGPVQLSANNDAQRGRQIYTESCASCHGTAGSGRNIGPYGAQPPFMYLSVDELVPAMAGGSVDEFAERSYAGAHATLPNMTSAAMLSRQEWQDLQAYVATFDGPGEISTAPQGADPTQGAGAPTDGAATQGAEDADQTDQPGDGAEQPQQPAQGAEQPAEDAQQQQPQDAPDQGGAPANEER